MTETERLSVRIKLSQPEGWQQGVSVADRRGAGARVFYGRFVRSGSLRRADGRAAEMLIEAAALEKNVEKFGGAAVFIDHAGFFERPSLEKLAGVTANPRYNPGDGSVEGEIHLNDTPAGQLARQIFTALLDETRPTPDVGLSLVFYAALAEGGVGKGALRRVVEIHKVESVDLVFQPAADGRLLQTLSTNFVNHGGKTMNDATGNATNHVTEAGQAGENVWESALAEVGTQALLAAAGLPEPARLRLSKGIYATPQELQTAIESERGYLAQLSQEGVIQIGAQPPRTSSLSGMRDEHDRLQLALDALLLGAQPASGVPPLTGVRELYHRLSGDYEMTGVFQGERVQLANVNSSTMASMVANAMNKVVAQEFARYPQWWREVVVASDFDSLQAVKWITLGGVGDLPTVAEGAAYTELSWDDKYESASFVKKGGYLGITLEAIDKDDTGRLRQAPRALAQAAWLTLSKSIASIFTSNSGAGPALMDGTALFHVSRGNLGSTALSVTAFAAARTAMRKFTELHSGERLGALTTPKYLLVPPDLEITALQTLASEYDYSYALSNGTAAPANVLGEGNDFQARLSFARQRVIVVDLWTDTNDWAATADPLLYPTIGLGFRYGRTPEIFSVASPTAGLMFSNDTLPIKVRFVYACGPVDWRGLYKANVV